MKKNILLISALYLLLQILVSCEKKDQLIMADSLFPINTGNAWTYKYTKFTDNLVTLDTFVRNVGEKYTINGYTCFGRISNSAFNAHFLIGNDEYGNFVNYGGFSDVDTLVTPSIKFKLDAKVGDEWESSMTILHVESGTFKLVTIPEKCISEDTLIITPKGKFHCKGFEGTNNSLNVIYRDYLSVNIGQVKSEFFMNDILISMEELLDYHLVK